MAGGFREPAEDGFGATQEAQRLGSDESVEDVVDLVKVFDREAARSMGQAVASDAQRAQSGAAFLGYERRDKPRLFKRCPGLRAVVRMIDRLEAAVERFGCGR